MQNNLPGKSAMWNNLLHHGKAGSPPTPTFPFWNVCYHLPCCSRALEKSQEIWDDILNVFVAESRISAPLACPPTSSVPGQVH